MLLILLTTTFLFFVNLPQEPDKDLLFEIEEKMAEYEEYISNKKYCILVDYTAPIFYKRLWVINLKNGNVMVNCHVSHALKTGVFMPTDFSNEEGSNKSPYGSFVTGETYYGKFGYSMRLHGLEKGINDNSFKRYITFHPIKQSIWSEGCFMTSKECAKKVIDMTKNGCFMFVHK